MSLPSKAPESDDSEIELAVRCLKAMAHPLRLQILCTLSDESINVQELVERVGTTQSNISQHLAIMRAKGLLGYHKETNRVYYHIRDQRILQLVRLMKELFCDHSEH